ncbi:MAG: isochorismatase family protein [Gammaproteobacteria bacterium]
MNQFEKSGYGSLDIGFGDRCAVLVVDFQRGFTDPASRMGQSQHVQRAVDNTATLIAAAKARSIPVASCRVAWKNRDDMSYWKIDSLYDGSFFRGHPMTDIDPRIADPDYIFEFTKTAPSIFFRTPLPTWLTKHNIDTTIITGCTTSGCVRASIIDSFSYGYRTIVPEDCCGDMDEGPHHDNLRDVGRRYADVLSLSNVLEHFNTLSPAAKRA